MTLVQAGLLPWEMYPGFSGVWKSWKTLKVREFNLRSGKSWKSQGIFVFSGNFCLVREFFHTFIVFAPSLSVHMPGIFFGPSKTAGKNVKKSGDFEKLSLENLENSGIFLKGIMRTQCTHLVSNHLLSSCN